MVSNVGANVVTYMPEHGKLFIQVPSDTVLRCLITMIHVQDFKTQLSKIIYTYKRTLVIMLIVLRRSIAFIQSCQLQSFRSTLPLSVTSVTRNLYWSLLSDTTKHHCNRQQKSLRCIYQATVTETSCFYMDVQVFEISQRQGLLSRTRKHTNRIP